MDATTTPAPPKWIDVLPERGGKRFTIEWQAHSDDYSPLAGFVVIEDAKTRTAYAVTESPDSPGRAFLFSKVGGKSAGTDPARESYVVRCVDTDAGPVDVCECSGFRRWRWCKHTDTARTLILNRWL
jgi:hypothetical protein